MNEKLQNQTNNGGMFVNKKHTNGDNFSHRNFFHSCILHVSRTCFWIGLFLITLVLIAILLGMGHSMAQ